MTGLLLDAGLIALLGGILSLDRTAWGQMLLSRPLAASALAGLILGCPAEGLFVGFIFELLFLHSLPVGSHIPLHPMYPALIAVSMLGSGAIGPPGWEKVPLAVCFSLPSLAADRFVEDIWRGSNEHLVSRAAALVRLGRVEAARRIHLLAVARCLLLNTAAIFITSMALFVIAGMVMRRYPSLAHLLSVAGLIPFFVGAAGAGAAWIKGRQWLGLAAGLSVGLLTGFLGSG